METHFESLYPDTVRLKEIEQILSFIKGGNSCQIISLPGVGRSNLLGMLAYNHNVRAKHLGENQASYHFVMINFSEIRNRPLLDAAKFIFLSLVDSLRERRMEEYRAINDIFKESLDFNDELVLFQGLKQAIDLLALEKQLTIVFLFDRFETYVPMLTSEFFSNLRALRNRAKYKFSVVFSLDRPLEEILEGILFADFYEFVAGHIIYLALTDKTGIDFRISYLEKLTGKTIYKDTKDSLLKLTGGHGKLVKICAETLLSHLRDKDTSDGGRLIPSGVEGEAMTPPRWTTRWTNLLLSQKTVQGVLWEIWHALLPEEQSYLASSYTSNGGRLNASEAMTPSRWAHLEKVGLLKNNKLTIPLFAEFIKTTILSAIEQFNNRTIIYDDKTNNILKGNQTISDKLTSLEFNLLRFFIQNPDRIIDREEIISAVWKDAKSTAGVTDQALDQLIFRLRKKIEDNPNNPSYLQTVKGRGFHFSA